MKKSEDIEILLVLAVLVFGIAFAFFAVMDSPGTSLAGSAGRSAMLTVLVVAVLGTAMIRKRRKGELDDLPDKALPEKETKTDMLWPLRVAVYFFVVVVFIVMDLRPERELIEVATVAARVAGWIFMVSGVCMALAEHIGRRKGKR